MIADKCRRNKNRAGRNLSQSDAINKLLNGEPTVYINNLMLDKRNCRKTSAKSKRAGA